MVSAQRKIFKIFPKPRTKSCNSRPSSNSYLWETKNETEINNHIYSFFNYLHKEALSLSSGKLETYLNTISFPKLTKKKLKIRRWKNWNKRNGKLEVWKIINHQEMIGLRKSFVYF